MAKIELVNPVERDFLVDRILEAVYQAMEYDEVLSEGEEEKQYSDKGNFLFSMREYDYNILKSIVEK